MAEKISLQDLAQNAAKGIMTGDNSTTSSIDEGCAFIDTPVKTTTEEKEPAVVENVTPQERIPVPIDTEELSRDEINYFNDKFGTNNQPQTNDTISDTTNTVSISNDPLKAFNEFISIRYPDRDDEWKGIIRSQYATNYNLYYTRLVVDEGFEPDIARNAVNNRYSKIIDGRIPENGNDVAIDVIIDKANDINDLALSTEEHRKLEKVNRIRLVAIDTLDLSSIKIETIPNEHKADYVNSIESSLSKHSVPLPLFGDFASFKGAQIIQMINAISYEDATEEEIVTRKASLIYDKLLNSPVLKKYDEKGRIIMDYNTFANRYAYHDIDIGLYAIACASSMDETSTSLTCNHCKSTWMQKYRPRTLLKLDNVSDKFKERIEDILSNRSNPSKLNEIFAEMKKSRVFRSPLTKNIYEIGYPTVAKALQMIKLIDSDDPTLTFISAIGIFINKVYVYNEIKDSYVEITDAETNTLISTIKLISNEDVDIISKQIRDDLLYSPSFMMDVKCASCGHESKLPLTIESLLFLKAQDIQEIEQ